MTSSEQHTFQDALRLAGDFLRGKPVHPLIVVLGPTASGKTSFSIRLAQSLKQSGACIEVVNSDSRQFYKFLDVGTAKVTQAEMQDVPHHLLSVLDPKEPCSIAWFQEKAQRVIADIHARGCVPVLVGGSMLYISALIDGFQPLPSDPELRKRLSDQYDKDQGKSLLEELRKVDPASAEAIPVQNKVYLVRAMEIYASTGAPKSSRDAKTGSQYDLLMLGMRTDSDQLKKAIAERARAMLTGGWIEEVKLLRAQGYTSDDPAMESHGYREISAALDRGDIDLPKLIADISQKSQQYAKRSVTWWKRDDRIHWITP